MDWKSLRTGGDRCGEVASVWCHTVLPMDSVGFGLRDNFTALVKINMMMKPILKF